jgi:hypothetical protein
MAPGRQEAAPMSAEHSPTSPAVAKADRRISRTVLISLTVIFLLGAFLRINRYAANRSLHADEAQFARNFIERTPAQLVAPLSYGQTSPPGFTLLVKFLSTALDLSEPVLRLVPLLAALASLPLFYLLATRWLPRWASLLALALFAVSDALGYYAAWFDKYSSDVLLAIVILLAGIWFYDSRRRARYLIFGVAGVVAVWFSYPVAIVLAGIGLPLLYFALRRKAYREALSVTAMAACWLASAAATWALSIRPVLENPSRGPFWATFGGFLVFPPLTIAQLERDIETLLRPFEEPLGFALYSGVVLLYGLGALVALRRGGTRLFLVAPFLITIVLSALRLYPLYIRIILFLVPLLLLTVVMGIVRLSEDVTTRTEKVIAFGFLALILYQPFRIGLSRGLTPREDEETRPLMVQLNRSFEEGDVLAVYYGAEAAYRYYAHVLGSDHGTPIVIAEHRDEPELYCDEIEPLAGQPRVWVLISHRHSGPLGSEERIIVECLDHLGREQSVRMETGASLYLYDLQSGQSGSGAAD